jgi:hypothetical protein
LSPKFKVREYGIIDTYPHPITISWKTWNDPNDTKERFQNVSITQTHPLTHSLTHSLTLFLSLIELTHFFMLFSSVELFKKNNPIPSPKHITFTRPESKPFQIDVKYSNPSAKDSLLPPGTAELIGRISLFFFHCFTLLNFFF